MKRRSLFKSLIAAPILAALPASLKPKLEQALPTTLHADAMKRLHEDPADTHLADAVRLMGRVANEAGVNVNVTTSVCSYDSIQRAPIRIHPPLYPHRLHDDYPSTDPGASGDVDE